LARLASNDLDKTRESYATAECRLLNTGNGT